MAFEDQVFFYILRLTKDKAYDFFIKENLEELYFDTIDYIIQEKEANRLEKEIKSKVHSKIEKTNKEYFLRSSFFLYSKTSSSFSFSLPSSF